MLSASAMTPAELAEATARAVMGWHTEGTCAWWLDAQDRATGWLLLGGGGYGVWNPAEDWRCFGVLLARLTEPRTDPEDRTRGWVVVTSSASTYKGFCSIADDEDDDKECYISSPDVPNLLSALCETALKAVRGER